MANSTPHPSPAPRRYRSTGSHLRRSIHSMGRPRPRPGHLRAKLFAIATRWDLVSRARAADSTSEDRREALAEWLEVYRTALVDWIKVARRLDDAQARELVQGFLVKAVDRNLLARAERKRGRLSAWLSTCLWNYAEDQDRPGRRLVPLLEDDDHPTLPHVDAVADRARDRKFGNDLVARAKAQVFQDHYAASPQTAALFNALRPRIEGDTGGETAAVVGARLGITANDVYTATAELKEHLRAQILKEMAKTLRRKGRKDVEEEIRLLIAALEEES